MLLNKELEDKIVDLLIDDGLVDSGLVQNAYNEVRKTGQPILTVLKNKNIADDDRIQHATAVVLKIPYVDLRNIRFDRKKLLKVPQDVAERSRIVPLGERNGQLVVAMLDTSNVQRMDYISTLVNMPIHAVLTSEAGIDNAMSQYVAINEREQDVLRQYILHSKRFENHAISYNSLYKQLYRIE